MLCWISLSQDFMASPANANFVTFLGWKRVEKRQSSAIHFSFLSNSNVHLLPRTQWQWEEATLDSFPSLLLFLSPFYVEEEERILKSQQKCFAYQLFCDLCPPCSRQSLHCTTSFHRKSTPVDLFQSPYFLHNSPYRLLLLGSLLLVSHSLGWTCFTIVQAWYLCSIYLTYGRLMHLFSTRQWECASLPYYSFSLSWILSLYYFLLLE